MGVPRGGHGWVAVLASAVLAGVTAVLANVWLPVAVGVGVGSAVAIIAGVVTSRGTNALAERELYRRGLLGRLLLTDRGWLPKVQDLGDPVALGVHPAVGMPEFIPRDITPRLCDLLRRDRFVLIVGESTAGKSRAAYEAMRVLCPEHRLVYPAGKEAIPAAVRTAQETSHCVLWLDDLERFLGADGLTGAAVSGVLGVRGGNRLILATMRAEEYAKYSGRPGHDDGAGRETVRRGWEVLRLATRVTLARMWSSDELDRAAEHRADPCIREALTHSDRFGVAEYLAAGPQLLADLQDAWAPGTHPRAAALVLAATDARRVGIHRPLTLAVLDRLHQHYLHCRGGQLLRPESLEEALTWATTPLHATSSLLLPGKDGTYLAFDYLIDAVDKDPIVPDVLVVLLDGATPEESMEIGEMAWRWHFLGVAESAFRQAQEAGHIPGTRRRCHLIRERDGSAVGLRFAHRELRRHHEEKGMDHPDAIDVADLVAWETGIDGDPAAALHQLEQLLPKACAVLGDEDEKTLGIKLGIAHWIGRLGEHDTAAELLSQAATDCARILGENHQLTIFGREVAAKEIGRTGDMSRAVMLMHELLNDMEIQQQHPNDLFSMRCQLAYIMTGAEDYAHALSLWKQLAQESLTIHGRFHVQTMSLRAEYAACVGEAGDPQKAVQLLHEVMIDVQKLEEPPSTNVLHVGRLLAIWAGKAGNPTEAVRRFDDLIEIATEQRGACDGWTLGLRRRRAHWVGEAGDSQAAVCQLEQLIVDAAADHDVAKDVHESLTHWRERTSTG